MNNLVTRLRRMVGQMHPGLEAAHVELLNEAADRIAALEAERAWRPISEQPPEGTEAALWCSSKHWTGRRTDCWFERGMWWETSYRDGDAVSVDDGQFWMPLPPAPEDKP